MQSIPVSPPPTTITCLPAALIDLLGVARRAALHARDGAVALVEVVHREVHAVELAARDLEVALHARADGDHDRVVAARAARRR